MPRLCRTGETVAHRLPLVRIGNRWVEAVVCPDLGGRVVALTDKTGGRTAWGLPPGIRLVEGGRRGVEWAHGAELVLGRGRLNSLGPVDWSVLEPGREEARAAVFLSEVCPGEPLAWHVCLSVAPDRAEVLVEARFENRSLGVVEARPAFVLHGASLTGTGAGFFELAAPGAALTVAFEPGSALSAREADGKTEIVPDSGTVLGPRGIGSFKLSLSFSSGGGETVAVGRMAAIAVRGPEIRVWAIALAELCQVVVGLETGEEMEARPNLEPGRPFSATLPAPIAGVVVRGPSGDEALRWSREAETAEPFPPSSLERALWEAAFGLEPSLERLFLDRVRRGEPTPVSPLGLEHAAAWNQARRAIRARDWAEADRWIDAGLQRQANDQLLWWLKSLVARHAGKDEEGSPSMVNAHYLAPLEPALRAEAFLSMNPHQSGDPNPLTRPLARHTDALLDVLNWLYDLGLDDDAARLADECLRHRDVPLARYLVAWSLLTKTRMEAEAAHQVRLAAGAPVEPPFPWRPLEIVAIEGLSKRFPRDPRLAVLAGR
jgi:hypothetical protein